MLDRKEVSFVLHVEPEIEQVRGNAVASDDEADDRRIEDGIIERLNDGDVWAWACVTVTATVDGIEIAGKDSLGCCSYASEKQFRRGGYYRDMCDAALADLEERIKDACQRVTQPLVGAFR